MAAVLALGCNVAEPAPPAPSRSDPNGSAKPVATFGAAVAKGPSIALTEAAKHKGQSVVTEGTVTRVCQERGCWLALREGTTDAVIRMHGHTFFVPTTSSGKHARVEGTVMLMKDGRECDEMEAEHAQLEIDATGVELN